MYNLHVCYFHDITCYYSMCKQLVSLFIFIFFPNVLLHYKMVAINFYININCLIFCAVIVYISNWYFKMPAIYIYVCILFHYFNLIKIPAY